MPQPNGSEAICTPEHPYDPAQPNSDRTWVHVGAYEEPDEWEGEVIGYRCPNCQLYFSVDYRRESAEVILHLPGGEPRRPKAAVGESAVVRKVAQQAEISGALAKLVKAGYTEVSLKNPKTGEVRVIQLPKLPSKR